MPSRFKFYSLTVMVGVVLLGSGLYFSGGQSHRDPIELPTQGGEVVKGLIPGQALQDRLASDEVGPEMVVIPPGAYWMGNGAGHDSESPHHQVAINRPLAVARYETTVAEFRRFVRMTGYELEPGCWKHGHDQQWTLHPEADWTAPGYEQGDDSPATCVNHADARSYARWMSEQTGKRYRLPSESEFEYFNRAGEQGDYPSPVKELAQLCSYVNGADASGGMPYANNCDDSFSHTSPVGEFPPNAFGLFDTGGNLWEFTADCWNDDYSGNWKTWFRGPPVDGSPWMSWYCPLHVIRGGSYLSSPGNLRLPRREMGSGPLRLNRVGIRLVRDE